MDGRTLAGHGADAELGHKAFHDGNAHAGALLSTGREHGTAGLLKVRDAAAAVLDHNVQHIVRQQPCPHTFHREALKEDIRPDGSREWHIMRRRPGTVGISAAIRRKYDVEVVPHLICGGWSKYDIEDSLIDMDFLGLHNVLALRGDKRQNEPRFVPYAQGHAHAADLVRQIQAMNRGEFIDGEVEECHHSKFSVGVAGYPEKHFEAANAQSDLQYLKEKVDAGADYIVTQMFFDNSKYFDFVERCRKAGITVPIIPGIKPISCPPPPIIADSLFDLLISRKADRHAVTIPHGQHMIF